MLTSKSGAWQAPGRTSPQQFRVGIGDEVEVFDQLAARFGTGGEDLRGQAQRRGHGSQPAQEQQRDQAGQRHIVHELALDLGFGDQADQIMARDHR